MVKFDKFEFRSPTWVDLDGLGRKSMRNLHFLDSSCSWQRERERERKEAFAAVKLHRQKKHNTKHTAHKNINSTLHLSNLKKHTTQNAEGAKGMKLS